MAENVLTRKIGPLPTWAWTAMAAVGVVGYAYLSSRKSGSSDSATSSADLTPPEVLQVFPPEQQAPAAASSQVVVPDVVGEQYAAGARQVTNAGLKPKRGSAFVGTVQAESPKAGSKVSPGAGITLSGKKAAAKKKPSKPAPVGGKPRRPAARTTVT